MEIFLFLIIHWYVSLFFQTIFLHRYASHNMFKMDNFMEKIFFFMTFLFQGSSFLHPAAYSIMHKRHHAHADTPKDPHSPVHIKNIFSFNWSTFLEYRKLVNEFNTGKRNDRGVPRWPAIEKISDSIYIRSSFGLFYFSFYLHFCTELWQYIFFPIHIFMGPIHGFIVNWYGHKRGYRNFHDLDDNSKNTLPVDFLMMGELYQNNHHKKPKDPNFAFKWFEIDFGYLTLSALKKFGIIK